MGLTDAFRGRLPVIQAGGPKPARFADSKSFTAGRTSDWRVCNYDSWTRSTSEFDSLAARAGKEISTNNLAILRSFRKADMCTAGTTSILLSTHSCLHTLAVEPSRICSLKWCLSSLGNGLGQNNLLQSLRKSTSGPTAKCSPENGKQ